MQNMNGQIVDLMFRCEKCNHTFILPKTKQPIKTCVVGVDVQEDQIVVGRAYPVEGEVVWWCAVCQTYHPMDYGCAAYRHAQSVVDKNGERIPQPR